MCGFAANDRGPPGYNIPGYPRLNQRQFLYLIENKNVSRKHTFLPIMFFCLKLNLSCMQPLKPKNSK